MNVVKERTARKMHRCVDCGRFIKVGQRYRYVTLSPRAEFNPSPGRWTHGAFHLIGACP